MGGNALKNTETRRLDAAEYHQVIPVIEREIATVLGAGLRVAAIQSYRNKPDFGDADILIESDGIRTDYKDEIARVFNANEVYRNGSVTSFDRAGFQVDVIAISSKSFDYAKNYFSFNDLGNLVGRVAHKMGLKHAFDGLKYPVREDTHMFAEITLTRDMDRALTLMGYSPKRFHQGFEDMKDIFEYTASTQYFDPSIYLLENRNATSRIRDSKRKTYNSFLKWLDEPDGLAMTERSQQPWHKFPESKADWLPMLRSEFPDFSKELDSAYEGLNRNRQAKEIFNGQKVSELTGLTGKELGHFIQGIRAQHKDDGSFVDWVISSGKSGIEDFINEMHQASQPKKPAGLKM